MRRRDATAALAAAGLLPLATAARAQGGPVEGRQYARLPQALPGTPGKIEVVEFFFYRCPHCYAFDPLLEAWVHKLPADVSFRRVPVGGQKILQLHQRMFYALQAMNALTPQVHGGIFNAIHRGGMGLEDEAAVTALVSQLGVDAARFKATFHAFGIEPKIAQGTRLAEACGVESVPALVVGGRWRTSPSMAGTPGQNEQTDGQQALAVADYLISLSRGKG
ncbi:thiol:disulfide interchange protein DsbA/DsbL [Roseateles saccharophilus]|uniref:Thiol:disulfide interchange protein n=1 Tax=Roseateles saccharophilus TaxID=304 RepID=A0A4R3VKI2_ROSSA|nr:thiol:disulfide interchange protein DsbA/DsbL [Roseateles saccharophilus]MDG0831233.1 thiol:disulfide interchange protein DsbA/DsbL [Roseateles saccharophilus]TCV04354.1 thiol:disulfide interchange protein DsbA [Roseateles saccharophilus]